MIARAGKPVARLVPLEYGAAPRELGFVREGLHHADPFDRLPILTADTSFGRYDVEVIPA